ncbi:non-ribosomal peptide synthetase [Agrococcus beijingensis]|uniref:non-ribosomal peptide synthetase n=1 Tax=Agrococcus beijingensis TaxID=3068634 RepID=UPI002741D9DD|nr:non-ribosomal peptide synthetase [Agrococcus sp. REN33]
MQTRGILERSRTGLLDALDVDAEAAAILDADGTARSRGQLRRDVQALAQRLPDVATGKRLVHVALRPDAASVVAYLAVLEAGHVALVTAEGARADAIVERYRPDLAATGDASAPFTDWEAAPRHLLHPDLALLLSTSGSTGSPKLARLSWENVRSNAHAIAGALGLRASDRAITTLPLHYCFGLSVLHSHLAVGASVVLHDASVTDAALWRAVDALGATTLAVVPHSIELLASTGELEQPHPSLRLIAQAGGRLAPQRVRDLARLGDERGFGLAVMYGQTEATARICVLDPSLAASNPDAVGTPIPGTSIRLDTEVPEAAGGTGEVVVRGPGVMLGYAEHPDDLALGAMLDELRTGDLGRIGDDGQLRIVGRRSGFVKVMGLRIDVAVVEAALESAGLQACVGGDATGLTVAVESAGPGTEDRARRVAAHASGLGVAAVDAVAAPLPRLQSGKVDRPAAAALVRAAAASGEQGASDSRAGVVGAVGDVLGIDAVDLDRSFVELGGDSLSHVQASVRLEAVVGALPRGWHHRPLAELARRAPRAGGRLRTVETPVLLRALAAIAICGSHAGLFDVQGGAHILLAVAGASAAAFAFSAPSATGRWRASLRILIGIAVPAVAIALLGMLATGRYDWSNVLLSHWLVRTPDERATLGELWFVEALVACIVVVAAALSVPRIARIWRRDPWAVAAALAVLSLVPRFLLPLVEAEPQGLLAGLLWLFAVGAAAALARTRARRAETIAIAVVGGIGYFPDDLLRSATIVVGIAVLVLVPAVRLPAWAVRPISVVAAASLHIYLVQFLVLSMLQQDAVETAAALAAGVLLWWVADRPVRRLQDLLIPAHR